MLFRVVVVGWDNLAFDGHAQRFEWFLDSHVGYLILISKRKDVVLDMFL
jgi:hypothetical protein